MFIKCDYITVDNGIYSILLNTKAVKSMEPISISEAIKIAVSKNNEDFKKAKSGIFLDVQSEHPLASLLQQKQADLGLCTTYPIPWLQKQLNDNCELSFSFFEFNIIKASELKMVDILINIDEITWIEPYLYNEDDKKNKRIFLEKAKSTIVYKNGGMSHCTFHFEDIEKHLIPTTINPTNEEVIHEN